MAKTRTGCILWLRLLIEIPNIFFNFIHYFLFIKSSLNKFYFIDRNFIKIVIYVKSFIALSREFFFDWDLVTFMVLWIGLFKPFLMLKSFIWWLAHKVCSIKRFFVKSLDQSVHLERKKISYQQVFSQIVMIQNVQ